METTFVAVASCLAPWAGEVDLIMWPFGTMGGLLHSDLQLVVGLRILIGEFDSRIPASPPFELDGYGNEVYFVTLKLLNLAGSDLPGKCDEVMFQNLSHLRVKLDPAA